MNANPRRIFPAIANLVLEAVLTGPAMPTLAADYTGPAKVLVSFPPGGATDVVTSRRRWTADRP